MKHIFVILHLYGAYEDFEAEENMIVAVLNSPTVYYKVTRKRIVSLFSNRSREPAKKRISSIPFERGTTNTAAALRQAGALFTGDSAKGDRPDKPNVVVLFTDGGSNNFTETIRYACKVNHDYKKFLLTFSCTLHLVKQVLYNVFEIFAFYHPLNLFLFH